MRKILFIIAVVFIVPSIQAQVFHFGFQPHYFISSGFRTDFDIKISQKDVWLSLSPIFYAEEGNDSRYDESGYKELVGYGGSLELIKYHSIEPLKKFKLYFSSGLQYINYDIVYEAQGWNNTIYDGLDALSYGWSDHSTIIQQYNLLLTFGQHVKIDDRMFFETYLGLRIKYADYNFSDEYVQRRFNDRRLSVGSKGIVPHLGIKFGVSL